MSRRKAMRTLSMPLYDISRDISELHTRDHEVLSLRAPDVLPKHLPLSSPPGLPVCQTSPRDSNGEGVVQLVNRLAKSVFRQGFNLGANVSTQVALSLPEIDISFSGAQYLSRYDALLVIGKFAAQSSFEAYL